MHILLINSEYPPIGGGAGNASANLADNMVKMGNQVTVLTSKYNSLAAREEIEGVSVVRVPTLRRKIDRSGAVEQGMFILVGLVWSLVNIRKTRPEVVLAFFGAPSGVIALVIRVLFGIPYVVSLRGGDVPGFRPYDFAFYHRLIGPLLHIVWRKAKAVVANSEGLRELGQLFNQSVEIKIIPNGVNTSKYDCEERNWKPAKLLLVGRVVYQKGIDVLFSALGGLSELKWELSIAGDGPMLDELRVQTKELKISERVNFLGWQSREELTKRYCEATLYVYPSRHEGMPNVVLEAMSSGLPVIASKIAGNEELVVDGMTGRLVPVEDVDQLRSAIEDLIQDADKRMGMGSAGRKRVEEAYTWESTAAQYLDILQREPETN